MLLRSPSRSLRQTLRDPGVEWLLAALAAGGFFLVLALI